MAVKKSSKKSTGRKSISKRSSIARTSARSSARASPARMSKRSSRRSSGTPTPKKHGPPLIQPMSEKCRDELMKRIRFNIKAFKNGTVLANGHTFQSEQQAKSAAFNQLRKKFPECFGGEEQ